MKSLSRKSVLFIAIAIFLCAGQANAIQFDLVENIAQFQLRHGPQGTGNYKGKRDRHEKPKPGNEKKKYLVIGYISESKFCCVVRGVFRERDS